MTSNEYKPLLSMVFKIKFLRAMLDKMTPWDSDTFRSILTRITQGQAEVGDFQILDNLYETFERKSSATQIPKT